MNFAGSTFSRKLSLDIGRIHCNWHHYVGTALTLQTSLGFLLTCVSIYVVPAVAARWGWRWSMAVLAPGPALGVLAMLALRRRPEAVRLAGGRR